MVCLTFLISNLYFLITMQRYKEYLKYASCLMYFFYILTLIIYMGEKLTFCSRKSQRIHHFIIHITFMSLNPMVTYSLATCKELLGDYRGCALASA
jgi:hypothetical protein